MFRASWTLLFSCKYLLQIRTNGVYQMPLGFILQTPLKKKTGQQGSRDGYSIIYSYTPHSEQMEQRGSHHILAMKRKICFFAKKKKTSRGGFFPACSGGLPATCVSFFPLEKFQWLKISDEKKTKNKFCHTFSARKLLLLILVGCICLEKIGIHAWFRQSSSPPFTDGWVFPQGFQGWH